MRKRAVGKAAASWGGWRALVDLWSVFVLQLSLVAGAVPAAGALVPFCRQ